MRLVPEFPKTPHCNWPIVKTFISAVCWVLKQLVVFFWIKGDIRNYVYWTVDAKLSHNQRDPTIKIIDLSLKSAFHFSRL